MADNNAVEQTSEEVTSDEHLPVDAPAEAVIAEEMSAEENLPEDILEDDKIESGALEADEEIQAEVAAESAAELPEEETEAPAPEAKTEASKPGKKMRWYIIHAYSGYEKKVAAAILETAAQKGLTDHFEEVTVPVEEVVEVRKGKKVQAERKFFPGYVLAKMHMTDATWQVVKNTDKVTGFLGGGGTKPQPITEAEANSIFQQVQEGIEAPKRAVNYEIGEQVKVIDGPFDSFIGVVEDIDEVKEKLKVSVSIFGRPTPVELEFGQVDKI